MARRDRLVMYVASLALISAAAGLIRSTLVGTYVPLYGMWHMPLVDAVSYYLIVAGWMIALALLSSRILRRLSISCGGSADDTIWLGVSAFSLTPFYLSGLLVLVPSAFLREVFALGILYGIPLLYWGLNSLHLVPFGRIKRVIAGGVIATWLIGWFTLTIFLQLLLPDYPARLPSNPPIREDVLRFQENVELLAEQFG